MAIFHNGKKLTRLEFTTLLIKNDIEGGLYPLWRWEEIFSQCSFTVSDGPTMVADRIHEYPECYLGWQIYERFKKEPVTAPKSQKVKNFLRLS